MALFILFSGLLGLAILIAGAVAAIKERASSFVPGAIFVFFIVAIINFIAFKLFRKLIHVFLKKDRNFRIKVLLFIAVPIVLFILVFIFLLISIFSMGFSF